MAAEPGAQAWMERVDELPLTADEKGQARNRLVGMQPHTRDAYLQGASAVCVAAIRALLRDKRPSDDASYGAAKGSPPGSSPSGLQQHSMRTVALGDHTITLRERFPNLDIPFRFDGLASISSLTRERGATLASCPPVPSDVLEYVLCEVVRPALQYAAMAAFNTEASVVYMLSRAVQALCTLFPRRIASSDALADTASMVFQPGEGERLLMGAEQHVRVPGTLRGRIELQFMSEKDGQPVYEGAMEVGQFGLSLQTLEQKVEQAMKEALCLWMSNAGHKVFQPVWVLLTDGLHVCRIEYDGANRPGTSHPAYYDRMPTGRVIGKFSCTAGAALFSDPAIGEPGLSAVEAMEVLMGAFIREKEPVPSVDQLQQRMANADEAANTAVQHFCSKAMAVHSSTAGTRKRKAS